MTVACPKSVLFAFCLLALLLFVWNLDVDATANYWLPLKVLQVPVDPVVTLLESSNTTLDELVFNDTTRAFHEPNQTTECDSQPPGLVGPLRVWLDSPTYSEISKLFPWLEPGGHGFPVECKARYRVAIVVPYRDRDVQLRIFLHNIHAFLKRQEIDYGIFIVEQVANQTFNRAKLMNVGYAVASSLYDWQCFIFHDVDLLPEDDRNIYSCPEQPRHMSVAVDKFGYKLPYGSLFGGVSALTKQQFVSANGFSNDYWGWGGEDDDISARVVYSGFKISRYPIKIARYKMIKHLKEKANPVNECRYTLMKQTRKRYREDGLSNLKFRVNSLDLEPTHTRVLVDLMEKELRPMLYKEIRSKHCKWP